MSNPPPPSSSANQTALPPPPPGAAEQEQQDGSRQRKAEQEEGEKINKAAKDQILRFIAGLRTRDVLDEMETKCLEKLLFDNSSTILFAAYSVALSANDASYFAEICKDLAQSLLSENGRLACEAQDEVFSVCDKLYIANEISENQLLYLRHLVLIRDETMATIYDYYQFHLDINSLAKDLYALANKNRIASGDDDDVDDDDDEEEEEEEEEERYGDDSTEATEETGDESAVYPEEQLTPISNNTLNGVVSLMLRGAKISSAEASCLIDMIKAKNEYVMAAYDLYRHDNDLDELKDTLMRCYYLSHSLCI